MELWSNTCIHGWEEGMSLRELPCTNKVTVSVRHPSHIYRQVCCNEHKQAILEAAEEGSYFEEIKKEKR